MRRDSTGSGEKALLLAVLKDGIRCLQGHGRPDLDALAEDAKAWITAVDDDHPCSFENICEVFGLDSRRLRARLLGGRRTPPYGREQQAQPTPSDSMNDPPAAPTSQLADRSSDLRRQAG